ncbi:hypothetical protein [Marinobacterium stanieri]|uniref:hypothetical protein n=1 Tax=Marinobacterium stanieri TaxID=49186 RepID=UPI000255A5CE|nr:hypothetical protein [Marinobacterium stanieri]
MTTDTTTLIGAMRALANDIQSEDGVANAAIAEAADRLGELQAEMERLRDEIKLIEAGRDAIAEEHGNALDWLRVAEQERDQLKARIKWLEFQAMLKPNDPAATPETKQVDVVSATFPPLMTGVNRPVLWHYQLDSIDTETLNVTNAVVIYSDIDTEIDPSGQYGNRQFTTVAITRAELREMLKCLDDDIERLKEHCPETQFS